MNTFRRRQSLGISAAVVLVTYRVISDGQVDINCSGLSLSPNWISEIKFLKLNYIKHKLMLYLGCRTESTEPPSRGTAEPTGWACRCPADKEIMVTHRSRRSSIYILTCKMCSVGVSLPLGKRARWCWPFMMSILWRLTNWGRNTKIFYKCHFQVSRMVSMRRHNIILGFSYLICIVSRRRSVFFWAADC